MKHEEKLYNQTQITSLLGISKATVSRYLNKLDVSAITENNSKFYTETTLKQLKKTTKIQ